MAFSNKKLTIYNQDVIQHLTEVELGGMPFYSTDLINSDNVSKFFGLYPVTRGWSLVLDGCKITNINTATKKCNIGAGYVCIGGIVYYIEPQTNISYPFAIKANDPTANTREFESGNVETITYTYDYSFKYDFNYSTLAEYPDELNTNPNLIFFDPFTCQKLEYVNRNKQTFKSEIKLLELNTLTNVTEDDDEQPIVGSPLNAVGKDGYLKWQLYGWKYVNEDATLRATSDLNQVGNSVGSDTVTLVLGNMPSHNHGGGDHTHMLNGYGYNFGDNTGATGKATNQNEGPFIYTTASGTIISTQGSSTPFDIISYSRLILKLIYQRYYYEVGYNNTYKFWKDGAYTNQVL